MNVLRYEKVHSKYRLRDRYMVRTPITGISVTTDSITLTADGLLIIKEGYGWDGPSGPTIDSEYTLPPSLEHDAFYELLRAGKLPASMRAAVDRFFRIRLIECGRSYIKKEVKGRLKRLAAITGCKARAWVWYRSLRRFGGRAAKKKPEDQVITLWYP